MTQLHRALRHAIGPLLILAAENGWIPEAAASDWTEAIVIALGFALPFLWSWLLDRSQE